MKEEHHRVQEPFCIIWGLNHFVALNLLNSEAIKFLLLLNCMDQLVNFKM